VFFVGGREEIDEPETEPVGQSERPDSVVAPTQPQTRASSVARQPVVLLLPASRDFGSGHRRRLGSNGTRDRVRDPVGQSERPDSVVAPTQPQTRASSVVRGGADTDTATARGNRLTTLVTSSPSVAYSAFLPTAVPVCNDSRDMMLV
jgi:hypothetical protein